MHRYSAAYLSDWFPGVYANASKGAVITEGGSRWYQPPFSSDAGSPLTAINFLSALAALESAGKVPFVPGALLSWELFVGEQWRVASAALYQARDAPPRGQVTPTRGGTGTAPRARRSRSSPGTRGTFRTAPLSRTPRRPR